MTSLLLFRLLLAWAVAGVLALTKLAFDALAADARGARLPTRSLRSAVRRCVRCGVALSMPAVFFPIFGTINWAISFKPFSYEITAYSGFAEQVVLGVGFWIYFVMAITLVDRLLDKLLPNGPATRTPTAESSNDRGVANGK
jgi:hypothetical protein